MELSEKQIARADDLLSEHGLVGLWGYVKVHLSVGSRILIVKSVTLFVV
jgi:hypothetical protein